MQNLPEVNFWRKSWVIVLMVSVLTLYPTLQNDWVNWDDEGYVLQNDLIRSLDFEGLKAIFAYHNVVGNYQPITVISLAVDYFIGGLNPITYHFHNLLLHLLNALLVFYFISRLLKSYFMAFVVAILFAIHPMHLESVAWVSARKDLIYAAYLLLALIFYLSYLKIEEPKKKWAIYVFILLFFGVSLLAKSQAMVFPGYLILIDFLLKRKLTVKAFLDKIPFVLLCLPILLLAFYTQEESGAINQEDLLGIIERIAIACQAIFVYLTKALVPYQLSAFYPYPFQRAVEFPKPFYFALLLIPLGLFIIWKAWKNGKSTILFCLGFFMVSLFPLLQLLPFGRAMMAERYTYLAYIGPFIFLAFLVQKQVFQGGKYKRRILLSGLALLVITFSSISFGRSKVWKNGNSLWSDVIEKYPNDYFGYWSRADYYFKEKKWEEAESDLIKSIKLYPHFADAFNFRAKLFEKEGDRLNARLNFERALKANENYSAAHVNLGKLLASENQFQEAIEHFNKAIEIDPNYGLAYLNRGVVNEKLNLKQEAFLDYSSAIQSNPKNGTFYRYRAVLYLSEKNYLLSIEDFTSALKYKQEDGLSFLLRAKAYEQIGEKSLAEKDLEMARKFNYGK